MATSVGNASSPASLVKYFDALVSTTLESYRPGIVDAISTSNAFYYELKKRGAWKSQNGGLLITKSLMYELGVFDSYDGYDELSDTPSDGITQVNFEWRQGAVPISYSMKELKQNKHRLEDLVEAKINQAEMGAVESFNKMFLLGSLAGSGSSLITPYVSTVNGSSFVNPLPLLIAYDPTASVAIGNLNQNTYSWWRNYTAASAATTYDGLLLEFDTMYDNVTRGSGGEPDLIFMDETSKRLLNFAYYQRFRENMKRDGNYPFDNLMFRKAKIVWDQYIPDVYTGVAATTTYGSAFFLNTKFFDVTYESDTNFVKTDFAKPPKGDSRLAHILWMGQTTVFNRRKQGVIGKIARTLS